MFHSRLSQTNSRLSHRMCTVLASLVLVCIYPSANMPTAQATTTTNITSTAIDQKTVPTTKDGLPTILNHWDCRSSQHPTPVIMIHGTFSRQLSQIDVTQMLHDRGYCVFGIDAGHNDNLYTLIKPEYYGTAHVDETTDQVNAFIEKVKRKTGAKKVDLIGHSQGGLIIRNRITRYGGKDVRIVMMLAGTHHGTTLMGASKIVEEAMPHLFPIIAAPIVGPAVYDQMVGSPFINNLNTHKDTVAGITYVVMVTPDDNQATPWQSGFITDPVKGATVYNINIKQLCNIPASEKIGHSDTHMDYRALHVIRWALAHATHRGAQPNCQIEARK